MFLYDRGEWWPFSSMLILPFLILLLPMIRRVRDEIHWKAVWATIAVFEVAVFCAERRSLARGHWIYNEARIWGPKILGVPIEEPFLYYFFPPLFIIALIHVIRKMLAKKAAKEASWA